MTSKKNRKATIEYLLGYNKKKKSKAVYGGFKY